MRRPWKVPLTIAAAAICLGCGSEGGGTDTPNEAEKVVLDYVGAVERGDYEAACKMVSFTLTDLSLPGEIEGAHCGPIMERAGPTVREALGKLSIETSRVGKEPIGGGIRPATVETNIGDWVLREYPEEGWIIWEYPDAVVDAAREGYRRGGP